MSLRSALLPSMTAARGKERAQDDRPPGSQLWPPLEPSVRLWSTDAGGGSRGRSGWLLGSAQQVETQEVQHHEDQHQPDENLLHPQTRVHLLLQPSIAGHHSHELLR